MNKDLIYIGEQIRAERKAQNLSQWALAEMIECERKALTPIENGSEGMRLLPLLKISEALEVSLDELLPAKYFRKRISDSDEMSELLDLLNGLPVDKAQAAVAGFKTILLALK